MLDLSPELSRSVLDKTGFCFLLAPHYNPGFKHVAPIRKELGFRTVFNVLGPLINPARPRRGVIGVACASVGPMIAEVLRRRRVEHVWVVHGEEGLDEVASDAFTHEPCF